MASAETQSTFKNDGLFDFTFPISGEKIKFNPKAMSIPRYLIGGTIFGLGWALAGACPGPMYILVGTGAFSVLIVILGALLGTYVYGVLKDKLPH